MTDDNSEKAAGKRTDSTSVGKSVTDFSGDSQQSTDSDGDSSELARRGYLQAVGAAAATRMVAHQPPVWGVEHVLDVSVTPLKR